MGYNTFHDNCLKMQQMAIAYYKDYENHELFEKLLTTFKKFCAWVKSKSFVLGFLTEISFYKNLEIFNGYFALQRDYNTLKRDALEIKFLAGDLLNVFTLIEVVFHNIANDISFENNGRLDFMCFSKHQVIEYKINEQTDKFLYFDNALDYIMYLLYRYNADGNVACECELCNKPFIPKTKKKTLFCDRVYENNRTCKEVGPKIKQKLLAQNDEVIKTYYYEKNKRYTANCRIAGISYEDIVDRNSDSYLEYLSWIEKATDAKNKYAAGLISPDEAIKIISE